MKIIGLCVAILVLPTVALAQSVGEKSGVNSVLGVSPSTQDFVTEAAISDMFEIEAGQLAQSKGQNTKEFGATLVKDHTATSQELKSLVSSGKIPGRVPEELDSSHKSKLDKLQTLSGADFDKQFINDNVSGHKDDVSLFERYAKSGDNPELKAFAEKNLPTLQHHLQMAQELNK